VTGDHDSRARTIVRHRNHVSRIDLRQLRRSAGDDKELEVELLGLFKVQAKIQLELMTLAKLESDFRLAVHTLKGAALAIGAMSIVQVISELEALSPAAPTERRQKLVARLAQEVAAAEAEISRLTA
jgi:HPt (histidine-containing phosphotransfer) domain-containing protein